MAFNPRIYTEIVGEMINRLIATTPLTDVNFGSVYTTMLEAAAQEDDEQYFQMLEIVRGYSLDTTYGSDLEVRAFEYGLSRQAAVSASTVVTIGDSSITKVSTKVYSGLPGSIAGSTRVNADSATNFTTSGSIIVGRGTPNVETVPYSSISDYGNYVSFDLAAGLSNDHGADETIVLSQGGDRSVTGGLTVVVPASDLSKKISFSLVSDATILDGESELTDIPVSAGIAGSVANAPIGSIRQFDSLPFSTAVVSNPFRVTNGQDVESDQALRDRIKSHIQSLSRGTIGSIISGVVGAVSSDDNKRVVSASIVESTMPADVVKLFIDDGTGFVPSFAHIGYEVIVSSATGGEKYLKTANTPLVKAFAETSLSEPYDLVSDDTLYIEVGGVVEVITFSSTDFTTSGGATAQEVVKKLNANAKSFEARLSTGGAKLRIFSRSNSDEQIRATGGTGNQGLGFPTDTQHTMSLYRRNGDNLKLLTKDGTTAAVETSISAGYVMSAAGGLCVVVDGKFDNPQYVFFAPTDFISPSSVGASAIVSILNAKLSGAFSKTSSNDTRVTISSNIQRSASSMLQVVDKFDRLGKYNGTSTSDVTTSTSITIMESNSNSIYIGHSCLPFKAVHLAFSTVCAESLVFFCEFWNGTTWTKVGVCDETDGFTKDGYLKFMPSRSWVKNNVVGASLEYFWIRLVRNAATMPVAPVVSKVRMSSINDRLGFPTMAFTGANKDYTLNRFIGQLELETPLEPFDILTAGSYSTRASLSSIPELFALVGGETLDVVVDGVASAVVFSPSDFATPGRSSALEVSARISKSLPSTNVAVDPSSRVVMTVNDVSGSLQVTGGSANAVLRFSTDAKGSLKSHFAAAKSGAHPFSFDPAQSIIAVVDRAASSSYTIPCGVAGSLTSAASIISVADTALNSKFPLASGIFDSELLITSKYYAVVGGVMYVSASDLRSAVSISYVAGGTAGSEIVNVSVATVSVSIQVGVTTAAQIVAAFTNNSDASQLATASTSVGSSHPALVAATPLLPPRSDISVYTPSSGTLTLASSLPFASTGDRYEILPKTATALASYWNNRQVSPITTVADVAVAGGGMAVQISSRIAGESGAVQVTGGTGNIVLGFSLSEHTGMDGYRHFTGLAQQAQWVVDGLDDNQSAYPGIRAAGIQVEVAEPIKVPVKIALKVIPRDGVALSAVSNNVRSSISAYVNNLAVGADVVLSDVVVAAKNVVGVFDVIVSSPSDNIAIADFELARVLDSDISIG